MKKYLIALAVAGTLGMTGFAVSPVLAGESCCPSEKAAKADKSDAKVEEVAMVKGGGAEKASSCESKCSTTCESEQVAMAKGGAAEEGGNWGYELGKQVPNFSLEDIHGETHTLNDYSDKVVTLIFWNQSCPWVQEVQDRVSDFTERYEDKDVVVLAVDAGINNSVEAIKDHGSDKPFHLLLNRDSDLARKFDAKFTPEVFVLDKDQVISYHGAFDNSRSGSEEEGTRKSYAEDAVNNLLNDEPVDVVQTRAFGCTIKFAPESESADATTY